MAKSNWLMVLPPVLFGGLAVMFYTGMQRDNPDALPTALAGRAVPSVTVTPLGDLPGFDLAAMQDGQVKLVNYWASWCAPCRVEHPNLEEMAAGGLPIYGVNYKDKPENALDFLAELGNPYVAVGQDVQGRMALDWGVYGVPETYVVDGQGRIAVRHAGPVTQRVIEGVIAPAIAKAQASEAD